MGNRINKIDDADRYMDYLKVKIWNYRSISMSSPIELSLTKSIDFILGLNNVGKTTLLKSFYEFKNILYVHQELPFTYQANSPLFFDHIKNRNSKYPLIKFQIETERSILMWEIGTKGENLHQTAIDVTLTEQRKSISVGTVEERNQVLDFFKDTLYIPSIRISPFTIGTDYYDFKLGHQFIAEWNNWARGGDIDKMNKVELLIEELKELFGFRKLSIDVSSNTHNLIITNEDGKFYLDELGTGISHFVIVLGNAMIRNPSFILIDEPETGLHPRLQEKFVRALATKAKIGLVATSHSIGLAKSVADKIFSLTKNENADLKLSPFGLNYTSTINQSLGELGYSQFVELGGNKILLVEGRTDVKSFKEILNKYGLEKDFIVIPFGGRQFMTKDKSLIFVELSELSRLNASVFVIFDSEFKNEIEERSFILKEEFGVFKETCESLGFKVFATEYYSTENYITQKAIDKCGLQLKSLAPFERVSNWPKEKNWLMFREMDKEDFNKTKLDTFIRTM